MKGHNIAPEIVRVQIAACTRIMNAEGLIDYSGHISARLPDDNRLLIQSFDDSRASLGPDDLLICDFDGNVVSGPEHKAPPREVFIHTEIMKARPDIGAIGHFHPETATMFTLVENRPLIPVKNHAARWAGGIPVHPDPGHVNSPETGRELATTLGDCHAALIRAHGVVVTAESVPALLIDAVHFEENAQTLFRAAALGAVKGLSMEEMASFEKRFNREAHIGKLWKYYAGRGVESGFLPTDWKNALNEPV
ncbi:MAG: class II aldolase/adducin family protein [Alphaproteobacteria bacterium]